MHRQPAIVLVSAAAPFATTSYSRARLLRQMHASGLLSEQRPVQQQRVIDPDEARGAPR